MYFENNIHMKKKYYILIIIICLLILIIYTKVKLTQKSPNLDYLSKHFNKEELAFVINNNIDINTIKEYSKYKYFNVFDYYHYEKLRLDNNYTYLESINHHRYPNYFIFYENSKPALFLDTPYVLVNKSFYLEKNFIPSSLVGVLEYEIEYTNSEIMLKREALEMYEEMYKDALKENIEFALFSGYRSYERQEYLYYQIYNDDTISARPGHSEHQTGYAIDISPKEIGLTSQLDNTPAFNWLVTNSYKYGFILRFPKDKTTITGYSFEPWHFRYVGSLASAIYNSNLTLEEYIFSNLEI
jgi:LAS superfamily LD-carboxypeptidase LdcB